MLHSKRCMQEITPESSVVEAARCALNTHLSSVLRAFPRASKRAGKDVEYVHQLRVATRRSMAAIELYGELLPRKQRRWFQRKLDRIRRIAGKARDLDVMYARCSKAPESFPPDFAKYLRQLRKKSQRPICKCYAKLFREQGLKKKVKKFVKSISSVGDEQLSFRAWAANASRSMVQGFLTSFPTEPYTTKSLHRFRVRVKAIRYGFELIAAAQAPAKPAKFSEAIEGLQTKLGRLNDLATLQFQLVRWNRKEVHEEHRNNGSGQCKWCDETADQLERALQEFAEWWTPDRVFELKEVMADMLGVDL